MTINFCLVLRHHLIVYYNPVWWRYLLMINKQTNLEVITLAIRSDFTPTTPAMSSGHNLRHHLSILSGRTSHNGIWLAKTCVVKTTEWVDTSLHTVYIATIVTLRKHNSIGFQVSMVQNTLIHVWGCLLITHCTVHPNKKIPTTKHVVLGGGLTSFVTHNGYLHNFTNAPIKV